MSGDLTSIQNIGPATAKLLIAAGITDAAALRAIGADEAYRRMMLAGAAPNFLWYFVLKMSLQGRPWNDAIGDEKKALRRDFEALVAAARKAPGPASGGGLSAIDAELDAIGVRFSSV